MQMQQKGWLLNGNKDAIWLTKGANKVKFDLVVPKNKGLLLTMYFCQEAESASAATEKPQRMSIKEAHHKLGHSDIDSTCKTAAELGIKITRGLLPPCNTCTAAKAKQKNIPKKVNMCQLQAKTNESCWT
jgi:hypothetical protein